LRASFLYDLVSDLKVFLDVTNELFESVNFIILHQTHV
jgi:hypothetical protein